MTVQSKNNISISSAVFRGLISGLLLIVLILSITRYVAEPQDNTRCHGMLNEGRWMTKEYKQWQPSGCMSRTYGKSEMKNCLGNKHIVYIGDSIMREQYYAMTTILHLKKPIQDAIHHDQIAYSKSENITIEMWWDPYLNASKTINLLQGKAPEKPGLLIMGSGVWYMRRLGTNYLSGWKTAIDRVFDGIKQHKIADKVMLSPVEIVEYDLLIPQRKETLTFDKIAIMNNYLRERESSLHNPVTPLAVPFVWNEIVTSSRNQTVDGLHFKEPVTKAQGQLALNYYCNTHPNVKSDSFPIDTTCCYSYPAPAWYQSSIFSFFLCFIPIGVFLLYISSGRTINYLRLIFPSNMETLVAIFIFGLSVLYMYIGDRSQLFGKMFKQFDSTTFSVLMLFVTFLGVVTLTFYSEDSNAYAGFLNRDQTDEWKGWMQLVILIYHFVGASRVPGIYNPIRVLVAAYLFQTGYGHFYFFYKKADFGIARILNVMVRLNLLTCVLAYVMNTDYLFYYFSPLVSFWFMVIWIMMRIAPSYNKKSWAVLSKMVLMSILTGFIIHYPGVLETVFNVLAFLFRIQWNVTEWRFRLSLDAWIIYIGMLCAYATIKLSEHNLATRYSRLWLFSRFAALAISIIGLVWFFWFEMRQTKLSYTVYHPYISWIPILSFITIRNFTNVSRRTHSRFFAFIGKISLETFTGQFHMWLAADTRGLLVVLPNASWVIKSKIGWWVNLTVSSVIFIFVCYYLGQATGTITRWISSGAQQETNKANTVMLDNNTNKSSTADSVPLLPTSRSKEEDDNSSSSSSFIEENKIRTSSGAAEVQVDYDSSEDDSVTDVDDPWEESLYHTQTKKTSWYKTIYHSLTGNYWVKSIICLTIMGIVNRFCF
ncbi:MAG: 10 TM acyl transferase domain found in Cas1p-domain-containing protein [Benjaminiella poitrasii]|nr:MAG: 10 TM acyl transferase domain found in Cas1p-domain-containing protein [Benjaminiella poitrasii]